MRIVEPQHLKQKPPKKPRKSKKKFTILFFLIVITLSATFVLNSRQAETPTQNDLVRQPDQTGEETSDETIEPRRTSQSDFRQFTGNEFRIFYDNLLQPNLERVTTPPVISGNDIADARIRQIAEARGYRLRSSPATPLPSIDGYLLQESLRQPWLEMKAAATRAGLTMNIISGYRSVDEQRQLFLRRLNAEGVNINDVANGIADQEINRVLATSSIPGYSKHHTGYTIDLVCAGFSFENFKNSPCYSWISANNYENAKVFGFIPNYPVDADLQGPDPEAWEYVWVGVNLLTL